MISHDRWADRWNPVRSSARASGRSLRVWEYNNTPHTMTTAGHRTWVQALWMREDEQRGQRAEGDAGLVLVARPAAVADKASPPRAPPTNGVGGGAGPGGGGTTSVASPPCPSVADSDTSSLELPILAPTVATAAPSTGTAAAAAPPPPKPALPGSVCCEVAIPGVALCLRWAPAAAGGLAGLAACAACLLPCEAPASTAPGLVISSHRLARSMESRSRCCLPLPSSSLVHRPFPAHAWWRSHPN